TSPAGPAPASTSSTSLNASSSCASSSTMYASPAGKSRSSWIPLDDPGGGGGGRRPPDDGSHTPGRRTRGSLRRAGSDPMSSEDGLRSLRGMDMTEERRQQQRQPRLDIDVLPIPADQAAQHERIADVMDAGLASERLPMQRVG